jgi:fimbrial chaperone protein
MSFRYLISPNKELKIINKGILLIVLCFLLTPALSVAGSFIVSPIRINFDSGAKSTVIKITNQDDEAVTIQLGVKKWNQNEIGYDTYEETKDIVVFPRILTLEKEEERIIRVGYQGDKDLEEEKAFRLYLNELPVNKAGGLALNFSFNIAMPIYVSPLKDVWNPLIEKVGFSGGTLAVKVKNNGNTHFIIGKITASVIDKSGKTVFEKEANGRSLLAGAVKTFDIDISEKDCIKADKMSVTVEVEGTTMSENLILDKAQCTGSNENEKSRRGQFNQ